MKRISQIGLILATTLLLVGCGNCEGRKKVLRTDTHTSGFAAMVSDDCFANITQETVDVFEALNEEAKILPIYLSEGEAIDMLLQDSIRLAVLARDLTDAEKEGIKARHPELNPRSQKVAIDGIALIINRANPDSLISLPALRKVITGEFTEWKDLYKTSKLGKITVVFDSPKSSTVRFLKDSVARGEEIKGNFFAAQNNVEVIDYVSKTPNAMGVIGVNWINNPYDTTQLTFNGKIRVMSVSKTHPPMRVNSFQPVPAYLYLGNYPLTRDVYVVLTDLRGTLPAGFTHFMAGDKGQKIILRSGLVPAKRPNRTVLIKEEF